MSLVNKVLADLEARQSLTINPGSFVLDGLTAATGDSEQGSWRLATRTISYLLLISVLAIGIWRLLPEPDDDNEPLASLPVLKEPVASIQATSQSEAVARVQEARVQEAAPPPELSLGSLKLDDSRRSNNLETLEPPEPAAAVSQEQPIPAETPADVVVIESVHVSRADLHTTIEVNTAQPITYTAYALDDPNRVVLELYGVRFAAELPDPSHYQDSGIANIRTRELDGNTVLLILDTNAGLAFDVSNRAENGGYQLAVELRDENSDAVAEVLSNSGPVAETLVADAPVAGVTGDISSWGEMQLRKSSEKPASLTSKLMNESSQLYQTGQVDEANAKLMEVLDLEPGNVAARSQLAVHLLEQGQPDTARQLLEQGLQQQPGIVEWVKLSARILFEQGDEDAAIALLLKDPPQVALDPDYHALLAALYQRRERHADAVTVYSKILQLKPVNGVWWMGLAISLEALARNEEALQAYRQATIVGNLGADVRGFIEQKLNTLSKVSGT